MITIGIWTALKFGFFATVGSLVAIILAHILANIIAEIWG